MAWTQDDLTKLEAAIAEGARRVRYSDKEVEYRTLREMKEIRDDIRAELGLTDASNRRRYADFSKGL